MTAQRITSPALQAHAKPHSRSTPSPHAPLRSLSAHSALHALGDPTRREIFERLASGPLSVAHLAEGLPVSRPAVSQHLKVLCEAKLVTMEKRGTRSMYSIHGEGITAIRNWLNLFWDDALANFKVLAEKTEKTARKEKTEQPEKTEQATKEERTAKTEKATKKERTAKAEKVAKKEEAKKPKKTKAPKPEKKNKK